MPVLCAENLTKTYLGGDSPVTALRGVSLTLDEGAFVSIMGPSGCGKSTLLHLCGAMDVPSTGSLTIGGQDILALSDDALTKLRREKIGFVFQTFNLLPTLTVAENIALPLLLAGASHLESTDKTDQLAELVGLDHRLNHYPQQLSGGEMQRCAIARAVIHQPALLVADEPTGNLDSVNGAAIVELLKKLNKERKTTILLATHDKDVAAIADTTIHVRDGLIERHET